MKSIVYLSATALFVLVLLTAGKDNKSTAYKMNTDEYQLVLPDVPYEYSSIEIPEHYHNSALAMFSFIDPLGRLASITDAGATLGRVIFYDRDLSYNRTISCASCHQQQYGFADNVAVSEGFDGMMGTRNALHIADLGFNPYSQLLWDDSQFDLNHMSILPFQNGIEMGITMEEIVNRMQDTDYYPTLFSDAFGSDEINETLIGEALGQFLSSIVATNTPLDEALANGENFNQWTEQELVGKLIFEEDCQNCHNSIITSLNPFSGPSDPFLTFLEFLGPHNTGLDEVYEDNGIGEITGSDFDMGRFKTPNLKNVALTAPYMHDGRFETLEDVVDFYSEGIQNHPSSTFNNSDHYLESIPDSNALPFAGFEYNDPQKLALVAFLEKLTDENVINNPIYSDPFELVATTEDTSLPTDAAVTVGPNPMRSHSTVDFGSFPRGEASIALYDLQGRLIKQVTTTNRTYTLLRDNLAAGTYILHIKNGESELQETIVVQ